MVFRQEFADSTQKPHTSPAVVMCLIFASCTPQKPHQTAKHNGYNSVSVIGFKYSAKCVLVFREQLGNNAAVRVEMGRKTKLKVLCETRWASRADCLDVFVTSF